MQKKAIANLLTSKTSLRMFVAIPKANFHASKAANVEVSIQRIVKTQNNH